MNKLYDEEIELSGKLKNDNQQKEALKCRIEELQADQTKNPIKRAKNKKEIQKLQVEIERLNTKRSQKYFIWYIMAFVVLIAVIITVMAIRENSEKAAKRASEVDSTEMPIDTISNVSDGKESSDYEIERFELSQDNDYSTMYSRDTRVFSVFAYPSGIDVNDFKIESNWEEYVKISDIYVEDEKDKSEISFKVTIDHDILQNSSDATALITVISNIGSIESEKILVPLLGVEISDANPLTLKIDEPQIATFKVVPASFPLEELQIGMNAYVGNLEAEIKDSEQDFNNNCQYVHVEVMATGQHNGMSTGYINLNDMYQYRGGTCNFTIEN